MEEDGVRQSLNHFSDQTHVPKRWLLHPGHKHIFLGPVDKQKRKEPQAYNNGHSGAERNDYKDYRQCVDVVIRNIKWLRFQDVV